MYLKELNGLEEKYKSEKKGVEEKLKTLRKDYSLQKVKFDPLEKERLILEKELESIEIKISSFQNEFDFKEKKKSQRKVIIGIILFYVSYGIADELDLTRSGDYGGFLMCSVISIYGLINYIFTTKRKKIFNKKFNEIKKKKHIKVDEIKKNSTILYPIQQKLQDCKNEIDDLSNNVNRLELYLVNSELLRDTKNVLDKDDNQKLDLVESTHIDQLIENNQVKIREIEKSENKSYIPDLVKINLFLNDYQKGIITEFDKIQSEIENVDYKNNLDIFKRDLNFYKVLITNLILMIRNLINDNLVGYYKTHDMFDKLSIFESNYEKKLISELIGVKNITKQLIDVTLESRDQITSELINLNVSMDIMSDELRDLNSVLNK
jgi:hypothetical protein